MIKLIFTMKRRSGMTRAAFRDHYETRHVPLALGFMPPPDLYRRNYVIDPEDADFDVVTEIGYLDPAQAEASRVAMSRPEVAATIRADEDRFIEPGSVRCLVVDPQETAR